MIGDVFGRPMRDLRISVTDKCNFRCPYCMPAEMFGEGYPFLSNGEVLTFEEIARLARIFVGLGVVKVRLTGGEPLVRHSLHLLVAMLKEIPGIKDLALTTNGVLLERQAQALKEAGLHRVTVSLDSLDDEVFAYMNGRGVKPDVILSGIAAAEAAGLGPIKINAVVQRGVNDQTLVDLARHFKGSDRIVRFIEYMDVGTANGWRLDDVVPAAEIIERISAEMPLAALDESYYGEVAERYGYRDGDGEIGVIASVTQPFCGDCTRVRLSADGKVYTCLFAAEGHDLRGPLRDGASDDELRDLIVGIWKGREDRYSEIRASLTAPLEKVEMFRIGG
ncbi:MAG TPA: GTP 3',8-cyclase MoaA [Dehalococcoidia bacterium]|nr:GTP 3',8-cyclase MoaA [Dehalococcoidia bacterium]